MPAITRLKGILPKVTIDLRLLQSIGHDAQTKNRQKQMHQRIIGIRLVHSQADIPTQTVLVIKMPEPAGHDGEQQPGKKFIFFRVDHEVDSPHLPGLNPDIPKTTENDGEDDIHSHTANKIWSRS